MAVKKLLDLVIGQKGKMDATQTFEFELPDETIIAQKADYFHLHRKDLFLDQNCLAVEHYDNGYIATTIWHVSADVWRRFKAGFGQLEGD